MTSNVRVLSEVELSDGRINWDEVAWCRIDGIPNPEYDGDGGDDDDSYTTVIFLDDDDDDDYLPLDEVLRHEDQTRGVHGVYGISNTSSYLIHLSGCGDAAKVLIAC